MPLFSIQTYNQIAKVGLHIFDSNYTISDQESLPDAILLRSQRLHELPLPASLLCIARAGAGVNNIPVERCSENGIVVFNTPGANANAVKELAITALLLSSRKIVAGIEWANSLSGTDIEKQVESGKAQFSGPEIYGKKLGVLGLGAIGVMVANAAESLGMKVYGYDPYISIDAAWGLSRNVKKAKDLYSLYEKCDYITLHLPSTPETIGMINAEAMRQMKDGVRIINLSRGEMVNDEDMKAALHLGKVGCYVTDFPNAQTAEMQNVMSIPHLGASTPESEDNCAVMAARQTREFLENGNIMNAVNYPNCELPGVASNRLTITHKNMPNMLGQISKILADAQMNILNMINKSKGANAYTMMDIENELPEKVLQQIDQIEGVIKRRHLRGVVPHSLP
ncbi:3-phosphoglycerate dehydrogenase [Taibaiella sp. KBW10]|uniref:phosphoglycerate dehydrogenase n=1 Tax=Taibaiella sp. KBW10 TaxID=2153357 RepID=UPI000F5A5B34|nr:phosphoglycerate dehydrogenase [Taibaiella sp. KBW10]RQO30590.1 3-phosphoglycerate dehydrogenase [Taibaiella sp. KBW10]